ncbi:hypothetical protein THIAE_04225 [Thiomicrospira aerophila AL3]|uniref:Nucleotidyltransferase n=1 Tax=Thiomicrospira aerophila AL3 TaxID=717772 RepID=W0DW46_9GAMM|nr:hypothetical protein [Thiomicrospira aerophila]AHF01106.1 hypothetical protein THIAE_04225 [Thiomicrospira aerophila AL3]
MLTADAERLSFLLRVVKKEIHHLDYALNQAFKGGLTLEQIVALDQEPDLALKLEAFTSRFSRLQDTLGDKLLPALLQALEEPKAPLLTNLNKAETYGWLESTEDWISLRQLRNQMVHEYIEDAQTFFDAVMTAKQETNTLKQFALNLEHQTEKRLNQKTT